MLRWLCPAALLLAGCFGNDIVFFSPGVEPLEENRAEYPAAEGSDLYPERFNAVFGREPGSYRWGHMKAYIHAPPAAVWAAYNVPEVITDRRSPDEADFERDVAPEYDWSFRVHYVVHAFTEVEWYEEFHFDLIEGTDDAPLFVAGRWQNVYGTPFLELVEGHHIIAAVDDQTTRIEVVEHLDAIGANDDTIPIYFDDLFRSIVAQVRGEPLPMYE